MATPKSAPAEKPKGFIFRPYITLPNGTVIWARNYGIRAFRIPVTDSE